MQSILFVCLGNICRSPLAHGIAEDYAIKNNLDIKVDSAGTSSFHVGENPCTNSIKVANRHGIDISFQQSRQVTIDDFSEFDLIVALDSSNYHDLKVMGCSNLIKLGDFGANGEDVPDPYFFNGFEGFENVFSMIEGCVEELFNQKL